MAHREVILRHALPAIHIETTGGWPPVGASKLGGQPDVPPGFAWPRVPPTPDWPEWGGTPLAFLAQFRLADVTSFDTENALPHAGMLYFFYEANEQPWGSHPIDRGGWHVFYSEDTDTLTPAPFPDALTERLPARAVRFAQTTTLLPWDSFMFDAALALEGDDAGRYHRLQVALSHRDATRHQLLGHPLIIQNDMQFQCQLVSHGISCGDSSGYVGAAAEALRPGAEHWRLLLQLDSDSTLGMTWGDVGHLYFWIEQERLQRRDFSNVWLVLQCY